MSCGRMYGAVKLVSINSLRSTQDNFCEKFTVIIVVRYFNYCEFVLTSCGRRRIHLHVCLVKKLQLYHISIA